MNVSVLEKITTVLCMAFSSSSLNMHIVSMALTYERTQNTHEAKNTTSSLCLYFTPNLVLQYLSDNVTYPRRWDWRDSIFHSSTAAASSACDARTPGPSPAGEARTSTLLIWQTGSGSTLNSLSLYLMTSQYNPMGDNQKKDPPQISLYTGVYKDREPPLQI